MGLLTLAVARETLWSYGSDKVYATATAAQKLEFDGRLNQVVERILSQAKPRHTIRRVYVPIYDNQITLPRNLEGLLGIKIVNDTSTGVFHAADIYSRFHEFARSGWVDYCEGVYPVSELAQTWRNPEDEFTLRVKCTASVGTITLVGGLDADWDEYASTTTIVTANGTVDNARVYNKLPQIQLPTASRTVSIDLYSVDTTTAVETQIARYMPGEHVPSYQRYTVNGSADSTLALIQGKLAYVPAVADTDIVYPGVLGALKQGLRGLQYEDRDDEQRATNCWLSCFDILDKNSQQLEGESALPIMRVADGFGCGDIPFVC